MSKKSYYVATAIPYVNDVPHIGFAYELIIADVLARYHILRDKDVFFSTGSDEHGGKIYEKALSLDITPEDFVKKNSMAFEDLAPALSVKYSRFIRTSDENHKKKVALIWRQLEQYIYKASYVGLYDQRQESFISEAEAKQIKAEDSKRFASLIKLEEENYFFKLSHFSGQILQAVQSDKLKIVPKTKRNEILNLLKEGLEDISISRPVEKLPWGVRVPGDSKHTVYVWFEALMNYITNLNYPEGDDFKTYWPCNTHVIGKDVIRFHAAIWPAMLLALGLELPKSIYVHGFVTVGGEKISKSIGNVISPLELVSKYGIEATRYYLMRHIPSYSDGDFSWEKMQTAYNGELANSLGNLVQRVQTMVASFTNGKLDNLPETAHDEGAYHQAFSEYRFDRALDYCWELIRGLNQYIDEEKPWALAKSSDSQKRLEEILAYIVRSLLQVADLLMPFLPSTAEKIIEIFGGSTIKPTKESLFPKTD